MKPSEIIIQKLSHEPNQVAHIRQLNKHMTNLYFVEKNTFWSDHLNKLMGKGYRFDMFDILAEESNRFPDRKIP
ncbi:MAG: hypothetical protein RBT45_02330, partial [Acholeplasmataceae bacterium]|nr:hypothetical protein [Acholeplasmataceae bacterium]